MKTKYLILGAICALGLMTACQKEEPAVKPQDIKFDIKIDRQGFDETKAVKTAWESGDVVYVVFDKTVETAADVMTMTYDGSSWTYNADPSLISRLLSSGKLCAIYSPNPVTPSYPSPSKFQLVTADVGGVFLLANDVSYTYADSNLKATVTLGRHEFYGRALFSVTGLVGSGWKIRADGFVMSATSGFWSTGSYTWSTSGLTNSWGEYCSLFAYKGELQAMVQLADSYLGSYKSYEIYLTDGTKTFYKTFTSKLVSSGDSVKFAGPNDLSIAVDATTSNGWKRTE